jgi:tetratricopeptide (TPR) repeat protein
MRIHPHDSLLREFLDFPRKRLERVLEHLETCAKCKARLAVLVTAKRFRRSEEDDYEPALDRAYEAFSRRQAALEKERGEAPKLLDRLINLIPERQQLLLRNSDRFRTWGLFELLIQYGEKETFVDPAHAEEIFRLALDVSTHLDAAFYGRKRIEDMRARTLVHIGTTYRIRMDLLTSEGVFEEASLRLKKGTEDIMEQVLLFDRLGSLRRAQRRLDEALQLQCRVIAIYNRTGDNHQVGKALIKIGVAHDYMGSFEKARSALCRSLDLIDPLREPRTALAALHNLVHCLVGAGRFMQAQRVLARMPALYQNFPEPSVQCRRWWIAGRLAYGLGRDQEAKALLTKARKGFLLAGASFEAALVSRELDSSGET